jgi:hypothetical protein
MVGRPVIVTLTSIPSRFPFLASRLEKILAQSVRPDSIEVYLPRRYRRFPKSYPVPAPNVPKGVEILWVDDDLGPATKILPACERWRGQDVDLLLCDDDRSQDLNWIRRLALTRLHRPHDIICERGWNIDERFGLELTDPVRRLGMAVPHPIGGRTLWYRMQRLASFGLAHPPRRLYRTAGFVDIFEGFLGALVPPNAFDLQATSIPSDVWMVDDVWLSGMAALKGTKIWVHDLARPVYSDGKVDKIDSLRNASFNGDQRSDSDLRCVALLRQKYGVWM